MLRGIALSLWIVLERIDVYAMLTHSTREHCISICLFRSPWMSLISILWFSAYGSCTCFIRLTSKYFCNDCKRHYVSWFPHVHCYCKIGTIETRMQFLLSSISQIVMVSRLACKSQIKTHHKADIVKSLERMVGHHMVIIILVWSQSKWEIITYDLSQRGLSQG